MPIPIGSRLRLEAAARALNVAESTLEDLARRKRIPRALYQGDLVFVSLDDARAALVELGLIGSGAVVEIAGLSRLPAPSRTGRGSVYA